MVLYFERDRHKWFFGMVRRFVWIFEVNEFGKYNAINVFPFVVCNTLSSEVNINGVKLILL